MTFALIFEPVGKVYGRRNEQHAVDEVGVGARDVSGDERASGAADDVPRLASGFCGGLEGGDKSA